MITSKCPDCGKGSVHHTVHTGGKVKYHRAIQNKVEQLEKDIETIKKQEPALVIIDLLGEKVNILNNHICGIEAAFDIFPKNKSDIESVIKFLGSHRYLISHTYDEPASSYKLWRFEKKGVSSGITMFAYFHKDGQSCKFVKVGTEVVDVMELVCE